MTKKFTFNDLQPRVEMLIDALENRGACASGLPYAPGVKAVAENYKLMLDLVRNKTITKDDLSDSLSTAKALVLEQAGSNQIDRIRKILDALDSYMMREYNKQNS
jgi:hypothetical protein